MDKFTKIQLLERIQLLETFVNKLYDENDTVVKAEWYRMCKITLAQLEGQLDDTKSVVHE